MVQRQASTAFTPIIVLQHSSKEKIFDGFCEAEHAPNQHKLPRTGCQRDHMLTAVSP